MDQGNNEILKYLRIIYRRRYIFIGVALLVMSLIAGGSYLLPKKYRVDSTVFIEKNVINRLVKGIAITPDINDKIRVLKFALLSRDSIIQTLEEVGSGIFAKSKIEQQAYIANIKKRTHIKIKGKDLFIVSIIDRDPQFAQQYINTLVSKYVEQNISAKRNETYGANRFLEEQLEVFRAKLNHAENAIIEFRKKQGIYFQIDEKSILAELKDFMKQIEGDNLKTQTLLARKKSMQQQLDSLAPTIDIFSQGQGDTQLVKIQILEKKLQELLLKYTENYPEVIRVRIELASLKINMTNDAQVEPEATRLTSVNPLYQNIQQKIFAVDTELSSLTAEKSNLEQLVANREKDLHEVPAAKKELAVLAQERDSYRQIYQELLGRMGQSEVSKQMEIGDKAATFRIVDPAILPEAPVSPNMVKMMLLAIFAGLGAGLGSAVLLDNFDNTLKDPRDLEGLGIDILAVIPRIPDGVSEVRSRRFDYLIYGLGGVYFSGIVGLLLLETLNRM
ncbi:MAG: chain length-determining protein [Geopsychrobacter sp.]|nr:chain length-determining protein [Geopsychrobacter sp.]